MKRLFNLLAAFALSLAAFAAPPVNDHFANSIDLTPAINSSIAGTTVDATTEVAEPVPLASNLRTVWYQWTATSSGAVRLFLSSTQAHTITVYTGSVVNTVTLLTGTSSGAVVFVDIPVTTGTTYRVQIAADAPSPASFSLALTGLLSISPDNYQVSENAGTVTLTATRTLPVGASTVNHSASAITASSPEDFTATTGLLSFGIGETSKTFTIAITNDSVAEADESFFPYLHNATGSQSIAAQFSSVTIIDDDRPGVVSFTVPSVTVAESVGSVTLTVQRTNGSTGSGTVDYSLNFNNGVSASAEDFIFAPGTLTFASGETSKQIIVPIINDTLAEGTEYFGVSLSNPSGVSMGSFQSQEVTVNITDTDLPLNDNFASATMLTGAGESLDASNIRATSEGSIEDSLLGFNAVWHRFTAPSSGVFQLGANFGSSSARLVLFKGTSYPNLVRQTSLRSSFGSAEYAMQAGETYYIAVGNSFPEAFSFYWSFAQGSVFAFEDYYFGAPPVSENAGRIDIAIVRYGPASGAASATVTLNEISATAGVDFGPINLTANFADGETRKTVSVAIINDSLVDPLEWFVVTISAVTNGSPLFDSNSLRVDIDDDDDDPVNDDIANAIDVFGVNGTVTGSYAGADMEQGEPSVRDAIGTIWYRWQAPVDGVLRLTAMVTTEFGSGFLTPDAFSGATLAGLIKLNPGGEPVVVHAGLTYYFRAGGPASVPGVVELTWTLYSGGLIGFETDETAVKENAGFADIALTRAGGGRASVEVYAAAGSATAGADYSFAPQTVVFADGETRKTVRVTLLNDGFIESAETITLGLRNFIAAVPDGSSNTVTISDDDGEPFNNAFASPLTLNGTPVFLNGYSTAGADREPGEPEHGLASVWCQWTPSTSGVTRINFTTTAMLLPGIAVYTGTSVNALTQVATSRNGVVYFAAVAGQTYRIAVTERSTDNPNLGIFGLVLSNSSTDSLYSMEAESLSVAEGGSVFVRVLRSGNTTSPGTVRVVSSGDSSDFNSFFQILSFGAGETTKDFIVSTIDDGSQEYDEQFSAILESTDSSGILRDRTSITIRDNEIPAPTNDNFANSAVFPANGGSVFGTLANATTEALEPQAGTDPENSVWYSWTAPADGIAAFTLGNPFATATAYTGNSLGSLTAIGGIEKIIAAAGQTYRIRVAQNQYSVAFSGGSFTLSCSFTSGAIVAVADVIGRENGAASIVLTRTSGAGVASLRVRLQSGTASVGNDFAPLDQFVAFNAGETQKTLPVSLLNDADIEGEERAAILLSDASGCIIADADAALVIQDDDGRPANDDLANAATITGRSGIVAGTNSRATAEVGETSVSRRTVWYRWTAPSAGTVTFNTAGSPLAALVNIGVGESFQVFTSFASGSASATIPVIAGAEYRVAVDTNALENGEYQQAPFVLNWTMSIPGTFSFENATQGLFEDAVNVVFTVRRTGGSDGAVAVDYSLIGETATIGVDFTGSSSGTLNFAAGETSKSITVGIVEDTLFEGTETFRAELTTVADGAAIGANSAEIISIRNDDAFTPDVLFAKPGNYAAHVNLGGPHAASGVITFAVAKTGALTGKLLLGGATLPLKGSFDAFGAASITLPRKARAPLTIALQLAGGGETLTGRVYDGTIDLQLDGIRAGNFNPKTGDVPAQTGLYTAATLASADGPRGNGVAGMTVAATGVVKFIGAKLGDGTPIAFGGFVSRSGETIFYVPLYKGKGSIAGRITFRDRAATDADSTLSWFKPAGLIGEKLYPGGFNVQTAFIASIYTKPAGNTRILLDDFGGNGTLHLGGPGTDFDAAINIAASTQLVTATGNPANFGLKFATATGAGTGTFAPNLLPAPGKKTPFTLVVLQKAGFGYGQFTIGAETGSVLLAP